jgi:Putative prokaryotic signal transducing protein
MDSQDLVTVYTVNSAAEAEIVRNAFKAEGIDCEIGGETQAGLAGVLEIDILTHASDAERARKLLRQLRKEKKERRQRHLEAKKARAAAADSTDNSEAIQELKPPLPETGITRKKKKPTDDEAES